MTPEELVRLEALETARKTQLESSRVQLELINAIQKRVDALDSWGKVLFKTIKHWETKLGKNVMPKGTFCGVEF